MTRQQIKGLITLTVSNYPNIQGKDISGTGDLWLEVFGKMDFSLFKEALLRTFDKAKFWPTIADIKEQIAIVIDDRNRRIYERRENNCPNCDFGVVMLTLADGTEAGYRCPCALGSEYNGLPPAPGWVLTSDRRILQGEDVGDLPF